MTGPEYLPFRNGPFLQCAVLCERLLQERDGVKTAVRMIDRITHTVARPDAPSVMEPFAYEIWLLVRFKAGAARGTMPFQIRIEKPNGESSPSPQNNILFEGGDDRGVDIAMPINITFGLPGLYWIDVLLDNVRVTRAPLRVIYNPIRLLGRPGGANPEPLQGL